MKLATYDHQPCTARDTTPGQPLRPCFRPLALVSAICLALSASTLPLAEANRRTTATVKRPVKAAALLNNPIKLGKYGGHGAYAEVRASAMDIMKRFPPDETVYVGVGRSPSSVMAFLKAAGGGGDEADFGAVDFPVSGLGHQGSRRDVIDATWADYQALFKEFFPLQKVKGAKRLLLIDLTSGTSTENVRYAVRKYLNEQGIAGVEIETFSLHPTAKRGLKNSAASPFVFRGEEVDHVASPGINGIAFGKEQVAVFTTGNVAGDHTPQSLKKLVNPDRQVLEFAIKNLLGEDKTWREFLWSAFPHLVGPDVTFRVFEYSPPWGAGPRFGYNPKGRGMEPEFTYLSAREYRELRDLALPLTKMYSPRKAFFLGVGRSGAAPTRFLKNLGDNVAEYLPIDDLSAYVDRGKPLSAAERQAFGDVFDAFIPDVVLQGNRDLVLFQKVSSGTNLTFIKPLVEQWLAAKGYPNKVRIVGMTEKKKGPAGFDAIITAKSRTLAELGTRKYDVIAPYDEFVPGSPNNTEANTPYDVKTKQAKYSTNYAPIYTFRAQLLERMVSDPAVLDLRF